MSLYDLKGHNPSTARFAYRNHSKIAKLAEALKAIRTPSEEKTDPRGANKPASSSELPSVEQELRGR